MDVVPEHIHDRCPIIMGGARDVAMVYAHYEKAGFETPKL